LDKKSKIFSGTIKDVLTSSSGTFFAALASLLFFILLSRSLGPAQFGLFSALIALSILISDLADFGVSAGLAHFVGLGTLSRNTGRLGRYLSASLMLKIGATFSIIVFALLFLSILTNFIFDNSKTINSFYFLIALLGSLVSAFFGFSIFALQAKRKYFAASLANVLGNTIRLILLMVIMITGVISIELGLGIYFFGFAVSAAVALFFLPVSLLKKPNAEDFKEIFQFNKWLAAGTVLFAIFTRLDTVLIVSLNSAREAGLYAVASRVTFAFPLIASTLAAVWSPRFSVFKERQDAVQYLKRSLLFVLLIAIGILIILPLSGEIIVLFFGEEYLGASFSLVLLFLAWAAFLLGIPAIQFITYYLSRSDIYAFLSFAQFIVIVGLDVVLIPQLGAIGAAIAFLIGNLTVLPLSYGLLNVVSRKIAVKLDRSEDFG